MLAKTFTLHVFLEPCVQFRFGLVQNRLCNESLHDPRLLGSQHLEELSTHMRASLLWRRSVSRGLHMHIARLQGLPQACFVSSSVKLCQSLLHLFFEGSLALSLLLSGIREWLRGRLRPSRLATKVLRGFDGLQEGFACEAFSTAFGKLAGGFKSFFEGFFHRLLLFAWHGLCSIGQSCDMKHLLWSVHSQGLAARAMRPDKPLAQEVHHPLRQNSLQIDPWDPVDVAKGAFNTNCCRLGRFEEC
mmetsp:Transcript_39855/g.92250  ORF Transcript_39855/g.92250 Transcript_39855/m.92250 type:complete len:245 (+) Transcript_39855:181-915(+)